VDAAATAATATAASGNVLSERALVALFIMIKMIAARAQLSPSGVDVWPLCTSVTADAAGPAA